MKAQYDSISQSFHYFLLSLSSSLFPSLPSSPLHLSFCHLSSWALLHFLLLFLLSVPPYIFLLATFYFITIHILPLFFPSFCFFINAEIFLEQEVYETDESTGQATVCAVLTGKLTSNVVVTISTLNSTATGEAKYQATLTILILKLCTSHTCTCLYWYHDDSSHIFTAPADFTAVSQDHTFTPSGGSARCSNIGIIADGSVEGIEFFFVQLTSSAYSEMLGSVTNAVVSIMDNDSQ